MTWERESRCCDGEGERERERGEAQIGNGLDF